MKTATMRARVCAVVAAGACLFALSLVYNAIAAIGLINDHFIHVAWGRQFAAGDWPLRDLVNNHSVLLSAALSAGVERIVGIRLLSEGLILGVAFGAATVMTFRLASLVSGSVRIGLCAAVLQMAIAPRSYSYPKVFLYALLLLLLWRYIDHPSTRRLVALALLIVAGFYFRHDHGTYLGLVAAGIVALRHLPHKREAFRRVAMLTAGCVAGVAPYLVYVQLHVGLGDYVGNLATLATRERERNRFEGWPQWPLGGAADVVRWDPDGSRRVRIGVRWSQQAGDDSRRAAAARHGLIVPASGAVDSGRFLLTDIQPDNVRALIAEPAVEDTAGLDRATGVVEIPGLWLGAAHLLAPLDAAAASAALLFYLFLGLIPAGVLLLVMMPAGGEGLERQKMLAVVLVALVTAVGFLREPLAVRVGDAAVAPTVLAAAVAGRWLRRREDTGWSRAGRMVVVLVLLAPVVRSVAVVGAARAHLEIMGVWPGQAPSSQWRSVWRVLRTSPPFAAWDAPGLAAYRAVRYIRSCSPDAERLLVFGFAPEIYYFADRPPAGRQVAYIEGHWSSEAEERANLARIDAQRPLLAVYDVGREATDLYSYPRLRAYLGEHYHPLGEVAGNDETRLRVLARNDRQPASTDATLGWPCYR